MATHLLHHGRPDLRGTHRPDGDPEPPTPAPTRPAPPPRRRGSGWSWLLPAALGALAAGFLVSGHYETATLGERLDATVERGEDAARGLADGLAHSGTEGLDHVAAALADVGITTSIKTGLVADPVLSAFKIDVRTERGIVTLSGPAPSVAARERASVLARAPAGVRDVRNELTLAKAPTAPSSPAP
ncbi:BON domain-containing protein [Aquabacterium sp.]|uniref:BON domain-containing protein n=1 Tax=Aquabacterium sp. TaxID=1872578 RepID=UPI003784F2CC